MKKSVALIYPYFLTNADHHILFQPLGIAYLAAQLREFNMEAVQYDCTFEQPERVCKMIVDQDPAIIGIYCMISMTRNAFSLLARLKQELPGALFVAGGPLPTLYPERFAGAFDVVFRGEADIAFPFFCSTYAADCDKSGFRRKMNLALYPGLYMKTGNMVTANDPVYYSETVINQLPIPEREGTNYHSYQRLWERNTGSKPSLIMLTRGCPFSCDFCSKPVFGNKFRKRDPGNVFKEITDIKSRGFNQLWIADDCFTFDRLYLTRFCRDFIRKEIGMTWSCLSRVTGITPALAALMKDAGCTKVYLGLESGSNETLKLMNKNTTLDDNINAVSLFNKAGIKTSGFFIIGYPGETTHSIEKTLAFALSLPLDEISFSVPYPLPGSALFERVHIPDKNADWDMENEVKFIFKSKFDPGYLKSRIEATMHAFHSQETLADVGQYTLA